jgi:acetylornithine/succinyldiaminopimelate/putrescine aminotransferase
MVGVELRRPVTPILRALLERGVWALPAGKNVLRLLPPLVISQDDLDRATAIVVEILRAA